MISTNYILLSCNFKHVRYALTGRHCSQTDTWLDVRAGTIPLLPPSFSLPRLLYPIPTTTRPFPFFCPTCYHWFLDGGLLLIYAALPSIPWLPAFLYHCRCNAVPACWHALTATTLCTFVSAWTCPCTTRCTWLPPVALTTFLGATVALVLHLHTTYPPYPHLLTFTTLHLHPHIPSTLPCTPSPTSPPHFPLDLSFHNYRVPTRDAPSPLTD